MTRPLPARVWRKMYREDARRNQGGRCRYCRSSIGREDATLDHVVPVCEGGSDIDPGNFAAADELCNRAKGRMSVKAFQRWLRSGDDVSAWDMVLESDGPAFRARRACDLMLARSIFRINRRAEQACKRIAASVGMKPRRSA